jgi:hypothetical protein
MGLEKSDRVSNNRSVITDWEQKVAENRECHYAPELVFDKKSEAAILCPKMIKDLSIKCYDPGCHSGTPRNREI